MIRISIVFVLGLFLLVPTVAAEQGKADQNSPQSKIILCADIEYEFEADFAYREAEFTAEKAARTSSFLRNDLWRWMENKYQSLKEAPDRGDGLIEGEIGIAYFNNLTFLNLYILRLEALSAPQEMRAEKIQLFCDALSQDYRAD